MEIDRDEAPGRVQDFSADRLVVVIPHDGSRAECLRAALRPLAHRPGGDDVHQMPRQALRLKRSGLAALHLVDENQMLHRRGESFIDGQIRHRLRHNMKGRGKNGDIFLPTPRGAVCPRTRLRLRTLA